jgi:hypothetical protein
VLAHDGPVPSTGAYRLSQRGAAGAGGVWNAIAQQVMMSRVNFAPTAPVPLYNMDAPTAGRVVAES